MSGLWEKLNNRHQQNVYNRNNANGRSNIYQSIINSNDNASNNGSLGGDINDWSNAGKGFGQLYGAFKGSGSTTSSPAITDAINSNMIGGGSSGSAITDAVNGVGGSGSAIGNAVNAEVGSSGASGSGGGTPWALIGALAKSGYNTATDQTDKDYSDTEESIIYPLQGASMGAQWGPWGALGGALYGLGYSFKDDLGMKNSNFLTQITHPIDMGDGGGLKIGGKSLSELF
jgi:hypothetical protein